MHLDEPVVVRCSAIHDHKDEVVVLVELGPLVELFRVLDRKRMKLEHITEDLKVPLARLIEVEPKKVAAREQPLDRVTTEVDLAAALIVDDVTDRGARAIRSYLGTAPPPRLAGRGRTVASRQAVFHRIDATSTSKESRRERGGTYLLQARAVSVRAARGPSLDRSRRHESSANRAGRYGGCRSSNKQPVGFANSFAAFANPVSGPG